MRCREQNDVGKPQKSEILSQKNTLGCFAHKAHANEHDFPVLVRCDLCVVDSLLIAYSAQKFSLFFSFALSFPFEEFCFPLAYKHIICYTVYRNRYIAAFILYFVKTVLHRAYTHARQ